VARVLGMSERLVGVTIVAIGTSLPELVTSAVAARRGYSDIAVGNVVGSNIFNIFLCVGVAALFGPVGTPLRAAWFEVGALIAMTSVAAWLIRSERTLSRREGAAMLALYVIFVVVTVFRG
jgi:cation:H+ antiporter